ncbi:unnamed protein product [Peronospora farinosa]|uniref:C3H1-type domain-containing protein n=1 Tax=Peronospora farinosa TaxID=134698 RepID=A0AAV0UMC5_9STRA|nr:unnamed protein product [Peronospora farinosa]CAI5738122.1 unnamed protein product [Peronospora farinosa]
MKTCKFFRQGTCRNGNKCRFSHETFGNNDGNCNRNTGGGFGSQSQSPFGKNENTLSTTQGVTMTESGRTLTIEELQHPPIWPLSGFAVFKGLPSIVTGDVSCEEARWEAYQELKASGNCIQSMQKFQALAAEKQTQRQRVIWLLENRQSAQKLFNGETLSEVEGMGVKSATSNPFGGGTATSPFGGTSSSFGGTTTVANPFGCGAAAPAPASSPFGNSASPAASFFGGSNSTAFGGTVASPFGGGSCTTTFRSPSVVGAGSGAGFGGSAVANPFKGAAATSAPSPFGNPATPTFGGAATPSSSPFGGVVSATASPFGIGSSVPTSAFSGSGTGSGFTGVGGDAAKPAASPFVGGTVTPASSPFGGNATAPTSSPFGAPSVTTPFGGISGATSRPNAFGDAASSINATAKPFGESSSGTGLSSNSTTEATNPFGASASSSTTTPSAFSAPSSSLFGASTSAISATGRFGNSTTSNSSLFGGSSVLTTATPPPPSTPAISGPPPEARDDAWNAEQFQQAEFSLGMVPTVPPPPQFC